MRKKMTMAEKIRRMIDGGYTNKAIIEKLKCKPQAVYNARYHINKERGLGAIGKPAPKPADGIGTPPKKRTRKQGTGITATPPVQYPNDAMRPTYFVNPEPFAITMVEPEPSPLARVWERVKNFVRAFA